MLPINFRTVGTARNILGVIASACSATCFFSTVFGQDVNPEKQIGAVFYIELENHNWTQPASEVFPHQLYQCPAAPYPNSLITPGNSNSDEDRTRLIITTRLLPPSGKNPSIHPSEPNYIWQEAGSNFGIFNDNDPYAANLQFRPYRSIWRQTRP